MAWRESIKQAEDGSRASISGAPVSTISNFAAAVTTGSHAGDPTPSVELSVYSPADVTADDVQTLPAGSAVSQLDLGPDASFEDNTSKLESDSATESEKDEGPPEQPGGMEVCNPSLCNPNQWVTMKPAEVKDFLKNNSIDIDTAKLPANFYDEVNAGNITLAQMRGGGKLERLVGLGCASICGAYAMFLAAVSGVTIWAIANAIICYGECNHNMRGTWCYHKPMHGACR